MAQPQASSEDLQKYVAGLDVDSFKDEADRKVALQAARSLVRKLERPLETMLHLAWHDPSHAFAMKTASDMKLFHTLAEGGKSSTKSIDDLAKATKADAQLVRRVMRVLSAFDTVREVGEGVYAPNTLTIALTERTVASAIDFRFNIMEPSFQAFPRFLQETGYKNPENNLDTPFHLAFQTRLSHFDWVYAHPTEAQQFGEHMAGYTSQRGTWDSIYPVSKLLTPAPPADSTAPILIDIGGGSGHDLTRFARVHLPSSTPGSLLLQDLPSVLSQIPANTLPASIKAMPHDFFTPQPVEGARAYYMHSVLHDWNDSDAVRILKNLRPALTTPAGTGEMPRLLINENVIPAKGCAEHGACLDVMMAALQAGKERSEGEWRDLLGRAGFKVVGVYGGVAVDEGIVEAVVDEAWSGEVTNGAA